MGPRSLALAALLALPLVPPAQGDAGHVVPFSVLVDGQVATGLLGIPASGASAALVVMCHGYGGSASGWQAQLQDLADRGYLAVAMDYRGDGWNVFNGSADTIAAARALRAQHPEVQRTVLWGFSMGGQVSGLAVMRAHGLFDYWLDSDGAVDWLETFPLSPRALSHEAGGYPWEVPQVWLDNAPALNQTGFLGSGLARAYITHGSADPLVTIDQGQQLFVNLVRQGVPVSFYVVATGPGPRVGGQPLPLPAMHAPWGYGIVLAKAAGLPDPADAAVQGVHDATLGLYVPEP
jgi:dipeptidyl aminopeptidase/acylaminoacyl peptidase